MSEMGIDISHKKPILFTLEIMDRILLAVTVGCKNACTYTMAEMRDWALESPKDKPNSNQPPYLDIDTFFSCLSCSL